MHEVLLARAAVKRSVLSRETGLIPGCRSPSVEEKATSSHDLLACMGRTPRSRRPCARGEVLCAEPGRSHPCPDSVPGRLGKATSRTPSMYVDEKSDEAIVLTKRLNNGRQLPAEGKGLTQGEQPLDGRGSDTEPKCRVDPNDGCASGDERD
jgi:hypothetical protein